MGAHPINLALRFLLELCALASVGMWGWSRGDSRGLRVVLALGLPLLMAIFWGVFAVPHDPSRSGAAPVPTPGALRLLLEGLVFALGVAALFQLGHTRLSIAFGCVVGLHYIASYDRVLWLLKPHG